MNSLPAALPVEARRFLLRLLLETPPVLRLFSRGPARKGEDNQASAFLELGGRSYRPVPLPAWKWSLSGATASCTAEVPFDARNPPAGWYCTVAEPHGAAHLIAWDWVGEPPAGLETPLLTVPLTLQMD